MNLLRSLGKESFQLTIDHLHTFSVAHKPRYTVKALLSPPGGGGGWGLFNFRGPRRRA